MYNNLHCRGKQQCQMTICIVLVNNILDDSLRCWCEQHCCLTISNTRLLVCDLYCWGQQLCYGDDLCRYICHIYHVNLPDFLDRVLYSTENSLSITLESSYSGLPEPYMYVNIVHVAVLIGQCFLPVPSPCLLLYKQGLVLQENPSFEVFISQGIETTHHAFRDIGQRSWGQGVHSAQCYGWRPLFLPLVLDTLCCSI